MKTAKPVTTSTQPASTTPFFSKENGENNADQERQPFFPGSSKETVQTKLSVGKANDSYEKEADRVADHVVQNISSTKSDKPAASIQKKNAPSISPLVQRKCAECEKEEQLQKKDEEDNKEPGIQRKPIFESRAEKENGDKPVQRKCKHCEEEEQKVQRKEDNGNAVESGSLEKNLSTSKSGGAPLSPQVNQSMSQAFGQDFSDVRVHTGKESADMSKSINAQAFTHGNHIYFNEGKYSTSDSQGQHLLAHELTHTVQQGGGSQASNTPSVQKDETPEKPKPTPEGFAKVKGATIEIHLTDFPLKQYASAYNLGKTNKMPKEERKTDQKGKWKEATGKHVKDFVNNFVKKEHLDKEPILQLTLIKNPTAKLYGSKEEITNEMAVPFWDLGGNAVIHQVEHAIDWQVLGKNADQIDNLVLLDKQSNLQLGNSVYHDINSRLKIIIENYKSEIKELDGVPLKDIRKEAKYPVIFDSFTQQIQTPTGSIISKSNIGGTNEPYKQEHFKLEKADIPEGKFVLRTSADRAGYLLPYAPTGMTVGRFFMKTEGNPKITGIYLNPVINGGKEILVENKDKGGPDREKIENESETAKIFLTNSRRLAARLRDFIGVKDLSPIIFDEPEITPNFGLHMTGKVDTNVDFLKENNIDISFELMDGDFSIQASITDIAKFPKPFNVTNSSLFIKASSSEGFSIGGELGFEIKKLGKGKLSAVAGAKGFSIGGMFEFESKKFEGSNIKFTYNKETKWKIGGTLKVAKDAFKGIKEAQIDLNYAAEKITFGGHALLDVPGIDRVDIDGEFSSAADFRMHGAAGFKKMPGVKSGKVEIEVTKKDDDFDFKVSGTAVPDLPKMPGELNATLAVSYDSKTEIFKVDADFEYTKGKVNVKVHIGVTNAAVNNGEIQNVKGDKMVLFGTGKIKITLIEKKATAELIATVKPEGELFVSGTAKLEPTPLMDEFNKEKVIDFPSLHIPLIGVPFVSIFLEIGGGVKFYFNWKPLTISGSITLPDTDINKLGQAKFGIDLKAESTATAGIGLQISVGIGAEAAVLQVKGTITGFAGIEISASVGAGLNMTLDLEKGLKINELNASLNVTPRAKFNLTGAIGVYLNFFVTTVKVWEWKKVLADGSVDLSSLGGLEVSLPIKFDDNNNIILPSIDDIKVIKKPELSAEKGRELIDTIFNDKKPDASDEEVKKQLRESVNKELRTRLRAGQSGNQSLDVNRIAGDVQNKYGVKDQKLTSFVIESVKTEMNNIANDFYSVLEKQLTGSKESLTSKIYKLDEFDRTWEVWRDKSLSEPLRTKLAEQDAAKKGKPVQRKPIFESEKEEEDEKKPAIQKSRNTNGTPPVNPNTESNIHSSQGKGEALPANTRTEMESAMGKELPDVTIHKDSNAASMNKELEANAFTHGKDIYFNKGKYDTESKEGKKLLAHELTHVVQQQNGEIRRDDTPPVKKGKIIPSEVKMLEPFSEPVTSLKSQEFKGKGKISIKATAKIIKSPEIHHGRKTDKGEEPLPYEYVLIYEREVEIKTESGSWIRLRFKSDGDLPFDEMEKDPGMYPFAAVKINSDHQSVRGTVEGDYGTENVKKLLAKKLQQIGENPANASQYLFEGYVSDRINITNPNYLRSLVSMHEIMAPPYTWFFLTTEEQYDRLINYLMNEMDMRMPKKLQKLPAPTNTPGPSTIPDQVTIAPDGPKKKKKRKDKKKSNGPVEQMETQPGDPNAKAEEEDEQDGWEMPGWLAGILETLFFAALLVGAVVALAYLIVYFIPALAVATVVKVLFAIIAVAILVYSFYTRYKEAKKHGNVSIARIIGVSILDTIGVAGIWEAINDESMLTGEKLNLSERERFAKGTGGVLALLGTFLGLRGWIKGGSAPKAPPSAPRTLPKIPVTPDPPVVHPPVDPVPADPVSPGTPEPPKPVTPTNKVPDPVKPATPTDKIPVDPVKPATPPEPPKPATPPKPVTPTAKVPVDPVKPTTPPEPSTPKSNQPADPAKPATPKNRKYVPSPAKKPPVADPNSGKTGKSTAPKSKTPNKTTSKKQAPSADPNKVDPSKTKDKTPGGATVADDVKVGEIVSVPYGENGAYVRGDVVDVTPTHITIEYNPKGKLNPSGKVKYSVPKEAFNEYSKSGKFKYWGSLRTYLMENRPRYRTGLVEEVWEANKSKTDGKVRDPHIKNKVLEWDPSKDRWNQWHMGHKTGYEYSKLVDRVVNKEITWDEFIEEYNKADNYYPEDPIENMKHIHEEREIPVTDEE